ncbi:hypothetical protein [Candidatus Electronema sp. TJ]|uniref:hypothetical protein n=1 Tax=Candidatus Electronema sp. TJ TaxID=3401573 RepID=UPI003AA87F10
MSGRKKYGLLVIKRRPDETAESMAGTCNPYVVGGGAELKPPFHPAQACARRANAVQDKFDHPLFKSASKRGKELKNPGPQGPGESVCKVFPAKAKKTVTAQAFSSAAAADFSLLLSQPLFFRSSQFHAADEAAGRNQCLDQD